MNIHNIRKLRILGKDYTVDWIEPHHLDIDDAEATAIGKSRWKDSKIYIMSTLNDHCALDTLLHEVIHALNDEMKIGLNEEMVSRLGSGLQCFLRDNFELEYRQYA